jgi:hypothetical protein
MSAIDLLVFWARKIGSRLDKLDWLEKETKLEISIN